MNENAAKPSSIPMFVLLALHAVCGVAIFWLMLKLVPQYEKVFKDFGAKLPAMTVLIIDLSNLLGMYWYLLVPVLTGIDVGIIVTLNSTRHTRLMTVWGILVGVAQVLLIAAILLATFVPLNALMNSLAK